MGERVLYQSALILFCIFTTIVEVQLAPVPNSEDGKNFELLILHNNDMHARFEEISKYATKCEPEDMKKNLCYGGFARVAHEVREYRKEAEKGGPPVLYLNAGDTYSGTPWFTIFRDNITAEFLNALSPNATSLGNHEFDEGAQNLADFLEKVKFPVLLSNMNVTGTAIENKKSLEKSHVFEINGIKIGVIGYLTPDTKELAKECNYEFIEETEAINKEAKILKDKGVNIIIALGHSGYKKDMEIAKLSSDITLVIGGHSHSYLKTGKPQSNDNPEGPYPTVVKNLQGNDVLVVQSYAFTKYLGKLHLEFDKNGRLVKYDGEPILLNGEIPQDSDILNLLELYRPNITAMELEIVGYTKVTLSGGGAKCRNEECNLGNLIADSFVHENVKQINKSRLGSAWTDAAIGLIQGGGIRAPIEKRPDGSITSSDILTVMPFKNRMVKVTMEGSILRKALQHSADVWDKDSNGGFLQVSGLKVVYDMQEKPGQRLKDVQVLCANCSIPEYSELKDDALYTVIMSDFLAEGGDGFDFKDKRSITNFDDNDFQFLFNYIKDKTTVYPGIEGRITLQTKGSSSNINSNLNLFSLSLIITIYTSFQINLF